MPSSSLHCEPFLISCAILLPLPPPPAPLPSCSKENYDLCEACFKVHGVPSEYVAIHKPQDPRTFPTRVYTSPCFSSVAAAPVERTGLAFESAGSDYSAASGAAPSCKAVHRGIICDACSANPITGTRYKSLM